MSKLHMAAIAASVLVLMGCGGGGGETTSTPTPIAKAEGVYGGTLVSGGVTGAFQLVVLEDDSMWALYGVPASGGGLLVQGLVAATGTSGNGNFSVTGKDYGFNGGVLNTAISGTYAPGVSVTGTTNTGASFSGTTTAVTGYTYNTPAQLSGLTGSWAGGILQGGNASVAISSTGTYSGQANGCAISGTMTPRPSGKNVFNVTYTNGTSNCAVPNLSGQGIAVLSSIGNGKQQLIIAVTSADKSIGTVAFVTK